MSTGKQICYLAFNNSTSIYRPYLLSNLYWAFDFVFQDFACNTDLNWELIRDSSATWLKSSVCKEGDITDCEGKWKIENEETSLFQDDSVVIQCGQLHQHPFNLMKLTHTNKNY